MAFINPFILANKSGIPRLEATGTQISGNDVTYTFKFQSFLRYPYAGLIIFKLPAYTAPAAAGTVSFESPNTSSVTVENSAGVNVESTNADLAAGGIFIGFYENGNLRLLTGI